MRAASTPRQRELRPHARTLDFFGPAAKNYVAFNSNGMFALAGIYGASRARTGDLLGAIQALSQLSYSPARNEIVPPRAAPRSWRAGGSWRRDSRRVRSVLCTQGGNDSSGDRTAAASARHGIASRSRPRRRRDDVVREVAGRRTADRAQARAADTSRAVARG